MSKLRNRGYSVYYEIGDVYDEYREKYNQSRVALSWSSLNDTPTRVFEAFGIGIPLLCNRTPDLPTFFVEGEHYLGFETTSEAVRQFESLIGDKKRRETMAGNAHRKASALHTWDHRITQILETVGLI